ncbi:MAG: selenide, water dikinase SelD [Bordetella sp.]|nr:MAG: selenide, water dikinase SelD [Bordetella sp.]
MFIPSLMSLSDSGGCGCKLSSDMLSRLLSNSTQNSKKYPNLLVGNETSDDAAIYSLNSKQALISTTDFFTPIVNNPYDFGQISATNAISDIYAMGGNPIMALAIVGMPIEILPNNIINSVLQGGEFICNKANIPIAGGHSINSKEPIYGLSVNGLINPNYIKKNSKAKNGSILILSKGLGVGILSNALKKNLLDEDSYHYMLKSTTQLNYPGIILSKMKTVLAMTDVTGFGLLGHLLEIIQSSKLMARIQFSRIPVLKNAQKFAKMGCITGASKKNWDTYKNFVHSNKPISIIEKTLLTDPQTSGGLLIVCTEGSSNEVLKILHNEGFSDANIIGEVISGENVVEFI